MIKKMSIIFVCAILMLFFTSCYERNEEDEFRTVPITNNPLVVPSTQSPLPGIPTPS